MPLRMLALHLFEAGQLTPAQGARLAGLSLEGFFELMGQAGLDAVSYPPQDLEGEVKAAQLLAERPSHRCRCWSP
jgi:predicted HTH domain antitoxin